MSPESKWLMISYAGTSASGKTTIHNVYSSADLSFLGEIKWFGRWRAYCFFTVDSATIYNGECLRDLAAFCTELTVRQRDKKRVLEESNG